MRTHETKRWAVLTLVGAGLLVLAGCGGDRYVATTSLSGSAEPTPVTTTATGTATATLEGGELTVTGAFSGLQSDLQEVSGSPSHVHQGAAGTNGPPLFNLTITSTDKRNGSFTGTQKLDDAQQKAFREGLLYVNVHTTQNAGGEIRGQFRPIKEE
jgi:hypothetical protein